MGTKGTQPNTYSSCLNDFHKCSSSDSFMHMNTDREGKINCGFTRDSSNLVPGVAFCHHWSCCHHWFTFFFFFCFCFFPLVDFSFRGRAAEILKPWEAYLLPNAPLFYSIVIDSLLRLNGAVWFIPQTYLKRCTGILQNWLDD